MAHMSVIAARRYAGGKRLKDALLIDGAERSLPGGRQFDWVGLCDPTPAELDLVRRQFSLHPLAVEDAATAGQTPKLEIYGQHLFIIARSAMIEEGENIGYGQTAIFLGNDFIVTVRLGTISAHDELRTRLESDPERLAEGPDYVAHAILDHLVDGYQPILERLDDGVQVMEERAIDEFPQPSTIRRIFRLRRQLRRFVRVVGPMEEVCDRLATTELAMVDPGARIWFRDVLDHVRRTMLRIADLRETMSSIVETAAMLEQHRQGDTTRQLAGWAAILAVPTAIAGIYGMNFDFLPELHYKWGYPIVLAVIFTICSALYVRFKRIGWI
jgi:magnesium transporter